MRDEPNVEIFNMDLLDFATELTAQVEALSPAP